jgi:hypothetical protein
MKVVLLPTLAGLALLVGCESPLAYTALKSPPHEMHARATDSVEVLDGVPGKAFTEVARFEGFRQGERAQVVPELRAYAAALGCDAVVVRGVETGSRTEHGYRGTCLMYGAY